MLDSIYTIIKISFAFLAIIVLGIIWFVCAFNTKRVKIFNSFIQSQETKGEKYTKEEAIKIYNTYLRAKGEDKIKDLKELE